MSQSSSSDDDSLSSGTYVIHSVQDDKDEERLVMTASSGSEVETIKNQMYKWTVTYYSDDKNYTIEATGNETYISTTAPTTKSTPNSVWTSDTSQRFTITPVTYNKTVYYEIETSGKVFKCKGKNEQVAVVTKPTSLDTSVLWDFEECSPYTLSCVTNHYFKSDPEGKLLPRFGFLKPSWDQLWDVIDVLNENAQGAAFYKLFLFGRHGHNEHNIIDDLGNDYDGPDAALTQQGCVQAGLARAIWDNARSENPGIGLPQLSFCSPMRRALATNTIMFSSELSAEDEPAPKMETLVVENCRERMYTDNSEERHSENWIQCMFPNFQIEDGFTTVDKLWDANLKEPFPHFRARARDVLDRVFAPENAAVKFVSITAHHEWTAMIMEVLGEPGAMDNFKLNEGGVLPVIIEYTPSAN